MKPAQKVAQAASTQARSVVLSTAGHIDHGKTALVYALTGTDADRLPEEKTRGITIDLGFASLQLTDAQGQTVELSLIDVPGHHAFIRNMLAGAGGIDCVMMVIAADEGVKPQTEEHFALCTLLGLQHGLVVLTKKDAVTADRLHEVQSEVKRFVSGTFLQGAPLVAVSAFTHEGLPALKQELLQLASRVPQRSADRVMRLPLDRAFAVRGFGAVGTGTLQAGVVRVGNALELQPQQRAVRVRGLQVHGGAREEAHAPNRVAVNLAGIEHSEIERGSVLVPPHTLAAVSTIDAEITAVPGAPALRHRSRVRVHAFTSDALATVLLYDTPATSADSKQLVRLRLAKPMVLVPGDRFVIRQPSPAATLGGGRVLDAHPLPRQRKAATQAWLQELRSASQAQQLLLRIQRRGVAGISPIQLVGETGLTLVAVQRWLTPLLQEGQLFGTPERSAMPDWFLTPASLRTAQASLLKQLEDSKANAVSRAELQSRTHLKDSALDAALRGLQQSGRLSMGAQGVSLAHHQPIAATRELDRLAKIEALYAEAGLSAPLVGEVSAKLGIAAVELTALLTGLLRAKRLVRLGSDALLVHEAAVAKLVADLQRHRGERFDVTRFKSFTKLTRKHAIPLLEYLDGARVTRNDSGTRTVL